jgi:lysophospholipase L1-like esterase
MESDLLKDFRLLPVLLAVVLSLWGRAPVEAQTLNAGNVQIEWKVVNRFRLFADGKTFRLHENAWRQYQTVLGQVTSGEQRDQLAATTAVLGTEHVLNDRHVTFTRQPKTTYDWKGWAARVGETCWDAKSRTHAACGGIDAYLEPQGHDIELRLRPVGDAVRLDGLTCSWTVGEAAAVTAPCDQPLAAVLPWPGGATISVGLPGEPPVSLDARVKDLLIVGLGDSFASGEGNPDRPVAFSDARRYRNLYPARAANDATGSAQWLDEDCHRSLYGHQLRAALQIAVENPQAAVTFLGYACSGAAVDEGILGPQTYVTRKATGTAPAGVAASASVSGGKRDAEMYRLLKDLCRGKPKQRDGFWTCPDNAFRRTVDFVFLSVGGNDIGFSNLVAWVTLRDATSTTIASYLGATVSPQDFARNMKTILPGAYARLAKALELGVPLVGDDNTFDPARVILTAYPDILVDETGNICAAPRSEGDDEDLYPANQSLDVFSSWLAITGPRLQAAHDQLATLHQRMGELAGDHGWTFAARAYTGKPFQGHGFCAQNKRYADDPAEILQIPCMGKAARDTATCESSLSGKARDWRPYNPASQNWPYALRQRWVRTLNDAYMTVNEKVMTKGGQVDDQASASSFSETAGAMHPTAEGNAAMADAILLDIRDQVRAAIDGTPQ